MSDEKQLSKARQALVDRVLSRLDAGAMPWDNGMQGMAEKPYNAITGKQYNGMNVLNLMLSDKSDPRWLTFNQAKDNGYTVKKGAKGVPIELYKTIDKRTGKDADIAVIKDEVKDMTFEERQKFKKENLLSFARSYYVFNASDVIGIEPYRAPILTPADISARNERIETAIANSDAPITYDGNGRNYYSPTDDKIHLTAREAFTSDEFFYNTALHEMAHSTGHSSRLNRSGGTFGTQAYAREELVAEISSVLTAAELGLNHSDRVIENSAEYVRSWAQLIREDPQTLIDATFDASRATDYICVHARQSEQAQEKTQKESVQLSRQSQSSATIYEQYSATQAKYPNAVVAMRLGDFYEVMGDKARMVADELELTLTSRNVGLPERIPMCGFPYHVSERYINKLLEKHDVAVVQNSEEKYIAAKTAIQKTPLENTVESAQKPATLAHTKPLVVNFYSGPSAGKSTAALELTAALKKAGYNVEYVSEYAKDLVLENRLDELNDQKKVTDEQYKRLDRLRNSVDIIVTDSPVLLGLVYGDGKISSEYAKQIRNYYDSFDNFNMLIARPKDATFQSEGRVHDEKQSIELDGKIKSMLDAQSVFYGTYKRDDIAKTVERIGQTYSRLYGEQQAKTQKESGTTNKTARAVTQSSNKEPRPIFKPENIPPEMQALPNWCAYQRLGKNDKGHYGKKIYDCNKTTKRADGGLEWAKSNDNTTWTSFDKALAYRAKFKRDGLAFGLSKSAKVTCIDLDKCIGDDGTITELARKFLAASGNTYAERSASGHGIHIFYAGNIPDGYLNRNDKIDLEVYDNVRLLSMTGDIVGNTRSLGTPSEELTALLKNNLGKVQTYTQHAEPLGLSDSELISRIEHSKVGGDFAALWRGEDICGNHSVSDMKLCNMLAFFSRGDVAQVERIFRSSGLYRPKKGDAYVKRTAEKACGTLKKTYEPPARPHGSNSNRGSGSGRR